MFYSQKFRCIVHVITKTKISFSIVIYQHQRETNKRKDQVPTLMNNILIIGCCVPSKVSVRLPIITFLSYAVYTTPRIFIIIVLFSSIHPSTNKVVQRWTRANQIRFCDHIETPEYFVWSIFDLGVQRTCLFMKTCYLRYVLFADQIAQFVTDNTSGNGHALTGISEF